MRPGGCAIVAAAIGALLLVPLHSKAASDAERSGRGVGERLHFTLESGALAGRESADLIGFASAPLRFMVGTGLQVSISPRDSTFHRLESVGVEYMIAFGHTRSDRWEGRNAVGPALTWRLSENWRLHDMAGPVWSSKSGKTGVGLQVRNYVSYKNVVSFETVYQRLPLTVDPTVGSGDVSSFYTGVVFHGKPGGYFLAGMGIAAGVAAIAFVIALSFTGIHWGG